MRVDHSRIELIGVDCPLVRYDAIAHHHQPINIGVQRAQSVGQLLRQHRNDTAREVHRSRTILRFDIERIAGLYIVADIGHRDDQPPPLAAARLGNRLAVNRVVEVARIFAVDRAQRHVAQIDPAAQIL